jgi:oxygen-independent coproporphyrinogen-3 oxidase
MGLYIHIPFCTGKCDYCDFYSVPGREDRIDDYLRAVRQEAEMLRARFFGGERPIIDTVYFGGGTPSSLNVQQIDTLGEIIGKYFAVMDACEFTTEANPESAKSDRLTAFMGIGVNRLSIGAQTFNAGLLKAIGRRHSREQTIQAVETAHEIGMKNVSLDLIFALPQQTVEDFETDLTTAAILKPQHISCYELMLEAGTKLYEMKQSFSEEEEETNVKMFRLSHDFLTACGFEHYEISNYAKEGYRCRHNVRYWKNEEYVGLGASAAGYIGGRRYKNVSDVEGYCKKLLIENSLPVESEETLSDLARAGESAMLRLRTLDGIERDEFRRQTGFDPFELFASEIEKFVKIGLLVVEKDKIHLNLRGLTLSNEVLADFLR